MGMIGFLVEGRVRIRIRVRVRVRVRVYVSFNISEAYEEFVKNKSSISY